MSATFTFVENVMHNRLIRSLRLISRSTFDTQFNSSRKGKNSTIWAFIELIISYGVAKLTESPSATQDSPVSIPRAGELTQPFFPYGRVRRVSSQFTVAESGNIKIWLLVHWEKCADGKQPTMCFSKHARQVIWSSLSNIPAQVLIYYGKPLKSLALIWRRRSHISCLHITRTMERWSKTANDPTLTHFHVTLQRQLMLL